MPSGVVDKDASVEVEAASFHSRAFYKSVFSYSDLCVIAPILTNLPKLLIAMLGRKPTYSVKEDIYLVFTVNLSVDYIDKYSCSITLRITKEKPTESDQSAVLPVREVYSSEEKRRPDGSPSVEGGIDIPIGSDGTAEEDDEPRIIEPSQKRIRKTTANNEKNLLA